jgi:wobble nucleotide-excising tRNase
MLEAIKIVSAATFDSATTSMDGLSKFNFVFGANGTGKTTLSRIIANCNAFPNCSLSWKGGSPLETVVYNRDFVAANFHERDELPGIFTLGEKDAETTRKLGIAKVELDELLDKLESMNMTLRGNDGNGGKLGELAVLEDGLRDACWAQKQKHDAKFKEAFDGVRAKQESFKKRVLQESISNSASLCDLPDLEKRAEIVFGNAPALVSVVQAVDFSLLLNSEVDPILARRVVGKADIDIAALILKLGNSDWVRTGRTFFGKSERVCPFCQQETPTKLEQSLNEFFDEAFERNSQSIKTLEEKYKTEASLVRRTLAGLVSSSHPFIDSSRLQVLKEGLEAKLTLNIQQLERKSQEPSQSFALEPLAGVTDSIRAVIEDANNKANSHNATVRNIESEKGRLAAEVWRYILDVELKTSLTKYNDKKTHVNAAIQGLRQKISDQEKAIQAKKAEIAGLEKETTSIEPTVNGINELLKSFGFHGFELKQADNKLCYKLIRSDGLDAKETLSEGERTFVTFLYFYHLLKGSLSDSGSSTNRIVVFDDPVSSLDSDILFIVGSLIKGLFDEVRSGNSQIRQVFVLTHNVYFHKEVSFNPNRQQVAMNEETFWIVRKSGNRSTVQKHYTNPIKSSYELLWAEVRNNDRSNLSIQNNLRRILENYFRILGGIDPDTICNKFEGKDRLICKSLFSWINDGSHSAHDDLYLSIEDFAVEGYLRVFRQVFERTEHLPHYRMMMGDAWEEETTSRSKKPVASSTLAPTGL